LPAQTAGALASPAPHLGSCCEQGPGQPAWRLPGGPSSACSPHTHPLPPHAVAATTSSNSPCPCVPAAHGPGAPAGAAAGPAGPGQGALRGQRHPHLKVRACRRRRPRRALRTLPPAWSPPLPPAPSPLGCACLRTAARCRRRRYTLLTFLPLNMFDQFKRIANLYFAAMIALQVGPWRRAACNRHTNQLQLQLRRRRRGPRRGPPAQPCPTSTRPPQPRCALACRLSRACRPCPGIPRSCRWRSCWWSTWSKKGGQTAHGCHGTTKLSASGLLLLLSFGGGGGEGAGGGGRHL
jgi:hypothetical protein